MSYIDDIDHLNEQLQSLKKVEKHLYDMSHV